MIRTHRKKVASSVSRTIIQLAIYGAVSTVLMVIVVITTFDFNVIPVVGRTGAVFTTFKYFLFCTSVYPQLAVLGLLYSETLRLNLICKDFTDLLALSKLKYSLLGPAYMELTQEWSTSNDKFDTIGGVMFFGTVLFVAGMTMSCGFVLASVLSLYFVYVCATFDFCVCYGIRQQNGPRGR
jgi:hypothetical protein